MKATNNLTVSRKRFSNFEKRDFPFVYILIAFPVLHFLVFWVYVNFSSFVLAFQGPDNGFTLVNFRAVFRAFVSNGVFGSDLFKMLGRSMLLWAVQHLICFPICVVTTYVLARKLFGHYVFRICYIIPSLMGAVIWASLMQFMVAYDGPVVILLKAMGVNLPEGVIRNGLFGQDTTAFPTLLVITFIMSIVGNNAVLTGAITRIPDEIYESSRLDGASFWFEFRKIVLPCIWPTIATLVTFSLCSFFTADANVFIYSQGTGEPGMATMGFHIYNLTYQLSQNGAVAPGAYGYPAALGMSLTAITIPLVLAGKKVLESFVEPVEY